MQFTQWYAILGGRARNFTSDSEDDLPGVVLREFPDFAASLCGGLSDEKSTTMITPEKFMAHILNYSDFVNRYRPTYYLLGDPEVTANLYCNLRDLSIYLR